MENLEQFTIHNAKLRRKLILRELISLNRFFNKSDYVTFKRNEIKTSLVKEKYQ